MMAPPALRPSSSSSRIRPADLILPIIAALGALYFTLRCGASPEPGKAPIFVHIALENPLADKMLGAWHFGDYASYARRACRETGPRRGHHHARQPTPDSPPSRSAP